MLLFLLRRVDIAEMGAVLWSGIMGTQKPALLFQHYTANVQAVSPEREERSVSELQSSSVGCLGSHFVRLPATAPVVAQFCRLHSGTYVLQTVGCRCCGAELGWLYVRCRSSEAEQYKQGCALLEQVSQVT